MNVKTLLNGHDNLIFEAMAAATADSPHPFVLPSATSDAERKHAEILQWLRFRPARAGESVALQLFEQIYTRAQGAGALLNIDSLRDSCALETDLKLILHLSADVRWTVVWQLSYLDYDEKIVLDVYDQAAGVIVPRYVVEFLDRAVDAYDKHMPLVAVALLSIAVEATLRDALGERGYGGRRVPPADVYKLVDAEVTANSVDYTVQFIGSPVRPASDFAAAAGGSASTTVRIRRKYHPPSNKWDLVMRAPDWMLDFWSGDTIEQHAAKAIGGLGEALRVAREVENIVTPIDLPLDLDAILTLVRNNTVHVSGPNLNAATDDGSIQTIRDFLDRPMAVFDTMHAIGRFINAQYLRMRGMAIP